MRLWGAVFVMVLALADTARAEVGLRGLAYRDAVHGGMGRMAVWYPTTAPEQPVRRGPFTLSVAENAPVAEGRHPLVVLSHGSGGGMLAHMDTAMALARRGYVVVALHHRGNTFDDNADAETERMWRGRPVQFSAGLDAVLADPALAPALDPARIGAVGFSTGGYTVLVAAGGVADMGRVVSHCQAHPPGERFCDLYLEPVKGTVTGADPRLRAAVVMAPVGAIFPDDGLAKVGIPIRLYHAERDGMVGAGQVERVKALLPRAPEYVVVEGAGHEAFLMPYPDRLKTEVGSPAQDPPGFDRAAFHERLNGEIADFFDRTLAIARPER